MLAYHGDVRLSTKIDLLQTAIRGSRCLPVDPSSAKLSANSLKAGLMAAFANEDRAAANDLVAVAA